MERDLGWGRKVLVTMWAITQFSKDKILGPRKEGGVSEFSGEVYHLAWSKVISKLEGQGFLNEISNPEQLILKITSNITQSRKICLPITRVSNSPDLIDLRLS